MKKIFLLLVLCLIGVAVFVNYTFRRVFDNNNNISVRVKEKENVYEFRVDYQKRKTRMVQQYMDEQLRTNHYFRNARMDATVTLDDKTRMHVEMKPGYLLIRLRKDENDSAAYVRVKELGEGIKERLGDGF